MGTDGLTDKVKTDPLWAPPAESPRASACLTDRPRLINQETEAKVTVSLLHLSGAGGQNEREEKTGRAP